MKRIRLSEQSKAKLPHYEPRRSNDDDWNDAGGVVCPLCHKEVARLLPYGYFGNRKACPECIENRRRMLEIKSRVLKLRATGPVRSGATRQKLLMIKYYAKRK